MYGIYDLSKLPIFKGKYINFWFWPNLNTHFDDNQRIKASELLYQEIAEIAQLDKDSTVADVGYGIGFGTQYIMNHYQPKMVVGLDFTPQQTARAEEATSILQNNLERVRVKSIGKQVWPGLETWLKKLAMKNNGLCFGRLFTERTI
jgi:cyclopropane fatty-acyl-phospholipid synthase-like methyltransferase